MIVVPYDWPEEMQLRVYRAAAKAEAMLSGRKASNVHRSIFWYIFRQIHLLEIKGARDRAQLAKSAGCSEDYAGRCAMELRAWGLLIIGTDPSGRWRQVLVGRDFFCGVVHSFIHPSSTGRRTPNNSSRSALYKNSSSFLRNDSETGTYSSAGSARISQGIPNGNGTRSRGRWASSAQLVRGLLSDLAPPGPS